MIWVVSQLFNQLFAGVAPLFNFIGDHRFGGVALLLVIAAAAAWTYVPIIGGQTAKALLVTAVGFATFDWGYSYRAAIDRAAESARHAAELAEHARREDVITDAFREGERKAIALQALSDNRQRLLKELDDATRNSHRPGLSLPYVLQLDKIR